MTRAGTKTTREGATPRAPQAGFTGPLFIVGMPRSGTKLIRDLLRGHPRVRIPTTETNLLPGWTASWHRFGDLSDRKRFAAFYRRAVRTQYFRRMKKHTGGPIPEAFWHSSCQAYDPGAVFEALLRHDLDAPPGSDLVWGDKSPPYTEHVALLARLFPEARFIHIIRDVRDYCLSLRSAWRKSMIRGAQRWVDGVTKARRDGAHLPGRYLEVRYEDLLADPERELRRCCDFLGLEYDPSLVQLRFSTEHRGAARGTERIVATNARKFERLLDPRTRGRIEAIAAGTLRELGYDAEYTGPPRRVPRLPMAYYRLLDAVNFSRVVGSGATGFVRTAYRQLAKRLRV